MHMCIYIYIYMCIYIVSSIRANDVKRITYIILVAGTTVVLVSWLVTDYLLF